MNYIEMTEKLKEKGFFVGLIYNLKPIIIHSPNGSGFELVVVDKDKGITGLKNKHQDQIFATFQSPKEAYTFMIDRYAN